MGVFTTQTLLNSVGASRNSSASAAVAINWILKVYFLVIKTPTLEKYCFSLLNLCIS